ncbi:hydroxyacylglutathione hydrolase [Sulfuricystis multivorans]|uniref:hydroxyacylglutathione hydrolase n=1 Tax=Sulfuricystis multivorans TaxID=2211108 RepID=UPI000F83F39F|nr:hydroxyacylglutathione hydrolase [Sulfuricystis multivorans]
MRIEPIPAFEDNYIWALRDDGAVALVDPGEAAPVLRFLERSGERLAAILVTHRHHDHIGGIGEILAHHPAPVYGPALEAAEVVTQPLQDGDRVSLLGTDFEVLHLPGHTLGHVAYYRPGSLLSGDVLFGAGCGRVFEGTLDQMQASLARIAALPGATKIYCAHEYTQSCLRFAHEVEPDNPAIIRRSEEVARLRAAGLPSVPSTLFDELDTNPFLRWRSPAVIAAATRWLGHPPANDVETFAAIRRWRDSL